MGLGFALAFDQARQRQHDRNAGEKYEQGKDQIVESEAFPGDVLKLGAEKAAGGVNERAFTLRHLRQRHHGAVEAHDPKHV